MVGVMAVALVALCVGVESDADKEVRVESSEAGVMMVVLAFEVVVKDLPEVMLGGGMVLRVDSRLVSVAAGVPLLMMVGSL